MGDLAWLFLPFAFVALLLVVALVHVGVEDFLAGRKRKKRGTTTTSLDDALFSTWMDEFLQQEMRPRLADLVIETQAQTRRLIGRLPLLFRLRVHLRTIRVFIGLKIARAIMGRRTWVDFINHETED